MGPAYSHPLSERRRDRSSRIAIPRPVPRAAAPSAAAAYEERRAAMLTVVVQEYIADMRPVFEHASNQRLAR
jgi:hypothetical protein